MEDMATEMVQVTLQQPMLRMHKFSRTGTGINLPIIPCSSIHRLSDHLLYYYSAEQTGGRQDQFKGACELTGCTVTDTQRVVNGKVGIVHSHTHKLSLTHTHTNALAFAFDKLVPFALSLLYLSCDQSLFSLVRSLCSKCFTPPEGSSTCTVTQKRFYFLLHFHMYVVVALYYFSRAYFLAIRAT